MPDARHEVRASPSCSTSSRMLAPVFFLSAAADGSRLAGYADQIVAPLNRVSEVR